MDNPGLGVYGHETHPGGERGKETGKQEARSVSSKSGYFCSSPSGGSQSGELLTGLCPCGTLFLHSVFSPIFLVCLFYNPAYLFTLAVLGLHVILIVLR